MSSAYLSMVKLLLSLVFLAVAPSSIAARGWRGIIPLHSTRADVENVLGKSTDACNCVDKTESEIVRVEYAKEPCEGSPGGWNVKANTLLAFSVQPQRAIMLSALHIDETKFSRAHDDAFFAYYANRLEGIQYVVSHEGDVTSIDYFPSTNDLNLRCKCFPPEDGSFFRGMTFDSFEGRSMDDMLGRLDIFAATFSTYPKD
jgi:hypothetical protein